MQMKALVFKNLIFFAPFFAACTEAKPIKPGAKPDAAAVAVPKAGSAPVGDAGDGKAVETSEGKATVREVEASPVAKVEIPAASNQEVFDFLVKNCDGCHGDKQTFSSFWPMDPSKWTVAKLPEILAVDQFAPNVYQALLNKSHNLTSSEPAPMPPGDLEKNVSDQIPHVLKWFEKNVGSAVSETFLRYPTALHPTDVPKTVFQFKCIKPSTVRSYVRRVVNDAFDREPTDSELSEFGTLDIPVTKEHRTKISERLSKLEWKNEFREKGLKKFASKLVGAADIGALGNISDEVALDLREEFYNLLKEKYDEWSFKDFLLSNNVMVSANTAQLYDCEAPARGSWRSCEMKAPRGSYFTTYGFLLSKPNSFLLSKNNYGRVGLMHFMVAGDVFRAATDGPAGETVKDLPACFKTQDYRGEKAGDKIAPFGSAKIPASGNICQSCHISRHLAVGSMVFRPFGLTGDLMSKFTLTLDSPGVREAIEANKVNQKERNGVDVPVDVEFLRGLLDLSQPEEQACIPGTNGGKDVILTSVKAMAEHKIGDGRVLGQGLARHLPRAFSNLATTNQELLYSIGDAYDKGKGKLEPVVQAYFSSETFACDKQE
jgi:hypothetical protein